MLISILSSAADQDLGLRGRHHLGLNCKILRTVSSGTRLRPVEIVAHQELSENQLDLADGVESSWTGMVSVAKPVERTSAYNQPFRPEDKLHNLLKEFLVDGRCQPSMAFSLFLSISGKPESVESVGVFVVVRVIVDSQSWCNDVRAPGQSQAIVESELLVHHCSSHRHYASRQHAR